MKVRFPRIRRDTRPILIRLLIGIILIAGIVAGPGLYGQATSGGRLAADLHNAKGEVNVRVVMNFQPQEFHQSQLGAYGVFAGRSGNSVQLLNVPAQKLQSLASIYWVSKVELLKAPG